MSTALQREEKTTAPATGDGSRRMTFITPAANVLETKDGYILHVEMPGVTKDGLEVRVEGNELVIVGHRAKPEFKGQLVYRESREWDYRREFELDPTIDTANVHATMNQGLLTLELPKTEKVKPRKIAVT